jgi:hypothetical protein
MTFLKTLTFSTASDLVPSPIEKRRHSLVGSLRDQLRLLNEPNLMKQKKKWQIVDGERVLTTKHVPVRPWWRRSVDGKVVFFVRSGVRRIEFEKGKAAIVLSGVDDIPRVIQGLIDAVLTGELDHLLAAKAPQTTLQKKRSA